MLSQIKTKKANDRLVGVRNSSSNSTVDSPHPLICFEQLSCDPPGMITFKQILSQKHRSGMPCCVKSPTLDSTHLNTRWLGIFWRIFKATLAQPKVAHKNKDDKRLLVSCSDIGMIHFVIIILVKDNNYSYFDQSLIHLKPRVRRSREYFFSFFFLLPLRQSKQHGSQHLQALL